MCAEMDSFVKSKHCKLQETWGSTSFGNTITPPSPSVIELTSKYQDERKLIKCRPSSVPRLEMA